MRRPTSGLTADTTEENIKLVRATSPVGPVQQVCTWFSRRVTSRRRAWLHHSIWRHVWQLMCSDVYKTTVYDLSRWRNEKRPKVPWDLKGSSFRTYHHETSLGELHLIGRIRIPCHYNDLDDILRGLIEEELALRRWSPADTRAVVQRVWRLLENAVQAASGSSWVRYFVLGRDRRYPLQWIQESA